MPRPHHGRIFAGLPMEDEVKYAVLIGRMLDLLQRGGDASSDDHRMTLRALVDLASRRSATLRIDEHGLTVEGRVVPDDTPFAGIARGRLEGHGIAAVNVASGASAVDLIHFLRALAGEPAAEGGITIEQRLQRAKVTTVSVLTAELDATTKARRGVRITEALRASGVLGATSDEKEQSELSASLKDKADLGVLPAVKGAAYDEMVRHQRASANTLAGAVMRLEEDLSVPALRGRLEAVQAGIQKALEQREVDIALEAIVKLIHQETAAPTPDVRRSYGIALRRILTADHLKRFAPRLLDEMYAADVIVMMRRAGTQGTKILIDLLIQAPTQAERKAYIRALRQIEEGLDVVTSLLNHHEWFVVRNAADLVGELRITEAAGALGAAVQHPDARVRLAVGIALARLGNPASGQPLRKVFQDPDPKVRLAVAKEIGGRGLSGLAMPLVSAAESEVDPAVQSEYYRALGRIGTPDAVQALRNAASAGSGLFTLGRRVSVTRLAAVEALGDAGGAAAVDALTGLAKDRAGDVRKAARVALQRARANSE